jgi:hypothetical protein
MWGKPGIGRGAFAAVVVVLLALPLLGAHAAPGDGGVDAAPAGAAPPRPGRDPRRVWRPDAVRRVPAWVGRTAKDRYVVNLRDDAPDPGAVADELARTQGRAGIGGRIRAA